jgi:hypothetical protein
VAIMGAVLYYYFAEPKTRSEALVGAGFIAIGAVVYFGLFRERKPR